MDLRPNLKDSAGNTHKTNMRTYTVGFADLDAKNDPLLQETADQGGGAKYTADDASGLAKAFNSATSDILASVGSVSAVAFNTTTLSSNSVLYQAQFNSANWTGNLTAYPINSDGSIASSTWNAATELESIGSNDRVILTYNSDNILGINFKTLTDLSTAEQDDLKTAPDGSSDTTYGSRGWITSGATVAMRERQHADLPHPERQQAWRHRRFLTRICRCSFAELAQHRAELPKHEYHHELQHL